MRKFKINVVSLNNRFVLILLLIIVFIIVKMEFVPGKRSLDIDTSFVMVSVFFSLGWYFINKFATGGVTEWEINNDGITINWIKPFFLDEGRNINLEWDVVEKLSIRLKNIKPSIIIELKSGDKLKFFHRQSLFVKDDFIEFIKWYSKSK